MQKLQLSAIHHRIDDRSESPYRKLNLTGDEAHPYAGRLPVCFCLEGPYCILNEASPASNSIRAASKPLSRSTVPISSLIPMILPSDLGIIVLMICKKDTEVEVLEKGEEPLGSWRPARILSGNGHNYVVKFDSCPLEAPVFMNKVPRKALRPRPPPVVVKSWACTDLAEVCDDGSWKLAEVLRNLDLNNVVARLLGSSKEIVTPFLKLRLPQIWKDNHWIPLQKESMKCKNVDVNTVSKRRNSSSQIPSLSVVEKKWKQIDRCAEKYDDSVDQWYLKSLGGLKKKSWECNPPVYPHVGSFGKKKQIKKRGRCDELTEKNLTNQPFEKFQG